VKALSIRNPWALLIVAGIKPVENRTWATKYRGPLAIHAGATKAWEAVREELSALAPDELVRVGNAAAFCLGEDVLNAKWRDIPHGALIGTVDLVDIVTDHPSRYANHLPGTFHWVLANPRPMKAVPLKGQLGLFDAEVPRG
jgi:hypothetical protein